MTGSGYVICTFVLFSKWFNDNCSNLSISRSTINYICTATSSICLTILLLLLVLLIFYRAYKTILQRLHLYSLVATVLNTLFYVLNVELQFDIDKRFCSSLAFLETWSENLTQLLTFGYSVFGSYDIQKTQRQGFQEEFQSIMGGHLYMWHYLFPTDISMGAFLSPYLWH